MKRNLLKIVFSILFTTIYSMSVYGNSSAHYYAQKTNNSPTGSGQIYIYRGGQTDVLLTSISGWQSADDQFDAGEIQVDQDHLPDGYKIYDPKETTWHWTHLWKTYENQSEVALHMYLYAKPNPGYQFDGWYSNAAGTTLASASTEHYPIPASAPSSKTTYTPSRWDNGGTNDKIPASGQWQDFYYTRFVDFMTESDNSINKTIYAKFSLIPRQFVLVGTFEDVTYTVNTNAYTVHESNVTTSALTSDLALSISYDANKYIFSGWKWSEGVNGTKTEFATTTSATYVLNDNTAAARGLTEATRVHIWPDIKEKASNIEVTHNNVTTSYETWDEAFAAAKAENVSGAIIKLKKDISGISAVQTVDRPITLNLNGHTISGTVNNMFTVSGTGAAFTIQDATASKTGRVELNISDVQTTYAVTVLSGATLNMESGTVFASNTKSDGTSRGVEIRSGGTLNMTGGNIEAQSLQNAYALINRGSATISGGDVYGNTTTAATAVGFYNVGTSATINGGSFRAGSATTAAYGIQQNVNNTLTINNATVSVTAATSTAYSLVRSDGKIVVNGGKYKTYAPATFAPANVKDKAQIELRGGIYSTYTNVRQCAAAGYDCYELERGEDWDLGYRFCVKSEEGHPRVCMVIEIGKTTYYESLADALAYANNNATTIMSIIMIAFEHTLPAGNYTLPPMAELVVPSNVDQTGTSASVPRVDAYTAPTVFRKLTLADGVHLEVYGALEAGGTQNSAGQGANGAGVPSGAYGHIVMNSGSSITLNDNSKLYGWGFITGGGTIDARRGAVVYEQFQMYDWKGGKNAGGMLNNSQKVFPVNQYFIQNIEAETTYHPGSQLIAMTSINVSDTRINCDQVRIVGVTGSGAMFLMDEAADQDNTWVRKTYDTTNDKQVYAINSSAHLGSMSINLAGVPIIGDLNFDSRNYTLPITSNLKIHLLSGEMDITENTTMLPGAEIEIDKTSTIIINSGKSLYLYDQDEWGLYVFDKVYAQQIRYSPTFGGKPNKRAEAGSNTNKPASASMNVHGTFKVEGALYTTSTGANIFSTNDDAGTVYFASNAPSDGTIYQPTGYTDGTITNTPVYEARTCTSAKLKNAVGYTTTKGQAKTNDSYCYILDAWRNLKTEGCFVYETVEDVTTYYAKPSDYVALANGNIENVDHTYSSASGSRTFILLGDCEWWEVVFQEASGLYYCEKNDTYYYYDEDDESWRPKIFSITWQNWNGTNITVYDAARYGSMPTYLGSTPKRDMDDYYTYDFIGWAPALSVVTADVTYIAQFERNDRKYTITWKDELGNTIETDYCTMGQIPVCYENPDMTGKEWSPAVSAVTGDQNYNLQTKVVKSNYTIIWNNWDGSELQTTTPAANTSAADVLAGYTEDEPTKPALTDIKFVFAGWTPTIVDATADAVYTATFTEQPITYTILWKNYDEVVLETDENVTPNTVPQYNSATPQKPEDDDNVYVFSGWTPAVVAAAGDATYKAIFNAIPKDKIISNDEAILPGPTPTYTNVTITPTGQLTIPSTLYMNVTNLYLEANASASGELIAVASNSINITGNAYYDLTLDTWARHWHAFGVPWTVDIDETPLTEVKTKAGVANNRVLTMGRDYDILYYDGAVRAQYGPVPACWKYVNDEAHVLTPGRVYMIAFTSPVGTLRFAKKAGASLLFSEALSVAENTQSTGNTMDGGWNGIANPMTYHAVLNVGVKECQVYDSDSIGYDNYSMVDLTNKKFIVGKAVYVQVGNSQNVGISQATSQSAFAAPRRQQVADETDNRYDVHIAPSNGESADHIYVVSDENKEEDMYTIVADLAKFGMSTRYAHIWVDRYDTRLAKNTIAPINGHADYPLGLYAPNDGEYTISLTYDPDDDQTMYLTLDGEAIWNLSESPYTLTLNKGIVNNYGLRIRAHAPQVITGIDEAIVDAQGETRKVLIKNQVYIIRGENVYTIDGQLVK